MRKRDTRRRLILGLLGGLVGAGLLWTGVGASADGFLLDLLQTRLLPRVPTQVSIVEIDPATLAQLGWPIPEERLSAAVQAVHGAGAKAFGFDLYFSHRGAHREARPFERRAAEAPGAGFVESLVAGVRAAGPAAGAELAAALGASRAVFASYRAPPPSGRDAESTPTPITSRVGCRLTDPDWHFQPLPPALRESVTVGHVDAEPWRDGVVRSVNPCLPVFDGCVADLASRVAAMPVAVERCGELALVPFFRSFQEFPRIELGRLLEDAENDEGREKLRLFAHDRIVLFTATDPTVGRFARTPRAAREPLAALQANRIDALLSGISIRPATRGLALAAAFALLAVALLVAHRAGTFFAIAAAGVVVAALASAAAFRFGSLWLPPSWAGLPFVAGALAAGTRAARRQLRDRRMLTFAFHRRIAPEVLEWLRKTRAQALELRAAEAREISVLVTDLGGHSQLAERLDPRVVMEALSDYVERMADLAVEHGGFVQEIAGARLVVLFGAPKNSDTHAQQAVACAYSMHRSIQEQREAWRERMGAAPLVRIGVATGVAQVGNIGGRGRIEYTAIGRAMGEAVFLERHCVPGGILVSETTRELLARKPSGAWRDIEQSDEHGRTRMRAWQI